jgi:ABC-type nitrate/sulfonate/bicarbonate transport system substrate-binding protein
LSAALQAAGEIDKAVAAMKTAARLIALLLALCCHSLAGAQEKVIVGHSARAALSIGPLLYGIERGFYRDEGIDLVYVSLRADLGIKALLSGDIDYSYSTGTIIRGAILGVPVRNLTFDFSRVLHALMSRPEIPNAAALRGKRVGVSSFGATGDLAARVGLRSLGLDPDKDVTIITLGTDTLRHAALLAGTVQATHMPVPLNIQLKKDGYHELVYAGKILQRPLTGLATSLEKIQKNPGQVQRMVRAFVRATRALKTERAGFISFAQKKYGYSKDVMEEAYKYLIDALSQDGFVDEVSLQAAIDEAKVLAKINKPVSQSDVVDYSFLRAATKK